MTGLLINVTLLSSTATAVALALGLLGLDCATASSFGLVAGSAAVLVS